MGGNGEGRGIYVGVEYEYEERMIWWLPSVKHKGASKGLGEGQSGMMLISGFFKKKKTLKRPFI